MQTFEDAGRTGVNSIRHFIFLRQKRVFPCSFQFKFYVCLMLEILHVHACLINTYILTYLYNI